MNEILSRIVDKTEYYRNIGRYSIINTNIDKIVYKYGANSELDIPYLFFDNIDHYISFKEYIVNSLYNILSEKLHYDAISNFYNTIAIFDTTNKFREILEILLPNKYNVWIDKYCKQLFLFDLALDSVISLEIVPMSGILKYIKTYLYKFLFDDTFDPVFPYNSCLLKCSKCNNIVYSSLMDQGYYEDQSCDYHNI